LAVFIIRTRAAQVSLSSLNRHAVATRSDVGLPKATVLKVSRLPVVDRGNDFPSQRELQALSALQDHFSCIVPEAVVEAEVAMFTAEDEERLLGGNPDFVLDAIDDIDTKVASFPHRCCLEKTSCRIGSGRKDARGLVLILCNTLR
jgi:tRNA A37 threonylcarbamoyladenosine dehydratase